MPWIGFQKINSKDSVVVSWWDYGYWITTISNRTTVADNAGNVFPCIETIAKMFMEPPKEGLGIIHNLKADYILIYIVAKNITINGKQYYILVNGSEKSKIYAISKVAKLNTSRYSWRRLVTPKPVFWNSIFFGNLIPFIHKGYMSIDDEKQTVFNQQISTTHKPRYMAVYSKKTMTLKNNILNNNDNSPLASLDLVYAYNSFIKNNSNIITGIFKYKIK
jgi:dolichyl-diphosphooligosaccharide--protein glycosyltransferase